jgi:hypothetical protein
MSPPPGSGGRLSFGQRPGTKLADDAEGEEVNREYEQQAEPEQPAIGVEQRTDHR